MSSKHIVGAKVFYIYGRFQPFTLGHKYLYDQMISLARGGPGDSKGSHAYLFVSHSSKKPSGSKKIVEHLRELTGDPSNLNEIKQALKKKNSIFDSPLDNNAKMNIISAVVGKSISSDGEISYMDNGVHCHIIDCKSTLYTTTKNKTANGFFGALSFLTSRHGDTIDEQNIQMFTGSDRATGKLAIPFQVFDRNNANSSMNTNVTKLSGSKIRALALVNSIDDIVKMYNGSLSKSQIKKLIVAPINKVILGSYSDTRNSKSSSSYSSYTSKNSNLRTSRNTQSANNIGLLKLMDNSNTLNKSNNSNSIKTKKSIRSRSSIQKIRSALNSAKTALNIKGKRKSKKSRGLSKKVRTGNHGSILDEIDD